MMRNLEWTMGAPEKLEPGMFVEWNPGKFALIGNFDATLAYPGELDGDYEHALVAIIRWAWVIKPHELEWAADMAGKHAKGRPEQ